MKKMFSHRWGWLFSIKLFKVYSLFMCREFTRRKKTMKKERWGICKWCSQKIKSETKKKEKLIQHLEEYHKDFQHKRK